MSGIASTLRDSRRQIKQLEDFAIENKLVLIYNLPAKLEEVLLESVDYLYLEAKETADAAGKLRAALAHFHNRYVGCRC